MSADVTRYRNYGGAMVPDEAGPWTHAASEPVLRDVIWKLLDVHYGPMSWNGEVTDAILRVIDADARYAFIDSLGVTVGAGHPFTCAYCTDPPRPEWRTSEEFRRHMRDVHPGMPFEPGVR